MYHTDPASNTWQRLIAAANQTDDQAEVNTMLTDFIDSQMLFNESTLGCIATQQETIRLLGSQVDRATTWAIASSAVAVVALVGVVLDWLVR